MDEPPRSNSLPGGFVESDGTFNHAVSPLSPESESILSRNLPGRSQRADDTFRTSQPSPCSAIQEPGAVIGGIVGWYPWPGDDGLGPVLSGACPNT
jgi:hypothetical protein